MSTTSLQDRPATTTRRRPTKYIDSLVAFRRLRINLTALAGSPSARAREHLIRENREIRQQHPAIDEVLGGALEVYPDHTAREAATILGMLGSDGDPTDAFYRLARQELDAYDTPSGKRVPRASLEAFRKGGGSR